MTKYCEELGEKVLFEKNANKRNSFLNSLNLNDLRCVGNDFNVKARSRKELTSKIKNHIKEFHAISKIGE